MQSEENPRPRWTLDGTNKLRSPDHICDYPENYEFLGQIDNIDVYGDIEELEQGYSADAGQILLIDHFTWSRCTLTKDGAPVPFDDDVEITFDQMCRLCLLLDQHGLMGPEPSHAAWDRRKKENSSA
jgi:hypothetical protein